MSSSMDNKFLFLIRLEIICDLSVDNCLVNETVVILRYTRTILTTLEASYFSLHKHNIYKFLSR